MQFIRVKLAHLHPVFASCPDGGIGRRVRLKIWFGNDVQVRFCPLLARLVRLFCAISIYGKVFCLKGFYLCNVANEIYESSFINFINLIPKILNERFLYLGSKLYVGRIF